MSHIRIIDVKTYYATRDGRRAKIYSLDGQSGTHNEIHGAIFCGTYWQPASWSRYGVYYGVTESALDLVSEWPASSAPIKFDWNKCCPPWCDYIAMTVNGVWYAFRSKPIIVGYEWESDREKIHIDPDYAPKDFMEDWKDSLRKRP